MFVMSVCIWIADAYNIYSLLSEILTVGNKVYGSPKKSTYICMVYIWGFINLFLCIYQWNYAFFPN